jgi:deoxyribonuclease V
VVIVMIACIDVHYRADLTIAGCVLLRDWPDERPAHEIVTRVGPVKPYHAGRFYERELQPALQVLRLTPEPPTTVVIDGYVWLDARGTPGLGAHLFRSLNEAIPVVGVAKSRFRDSAFAVRVVRGSSTRALYVTAAGLSPDTAARCIERMHGRHRIPTMLRRVDQLCRRG